MQQKFGRKGSNFPASIGYVRLNVLIHKRLKIPLDVLVEPDANGFIARTIDFPLYGFADNPFEALTILKREIEMVYDELVADNDFTPDWLRIKEFLVRAIDE
jgi:hypothetical protein